MRGKISPGWWGWGGARPPPFTTFTITSKVAVYTPAEWADTLTPCFISSKNMYSVIPPKSFWLSEVYHWLTLSGWRPLSLTLHSSRRGWPATSGGLGRRMVTSTGGTEITGTILWEYAIRLADLQLIFQGSLRKCPDPLQRTNAENWKQIFPEKELREHSLTFHSHVSVTYTWTWKLRLVPRNSQKRNT